MMNEQSLFATMNPAVLAIMLLVICVIGVGCARSCRDTNDFAKSIKIYLPIAIVMLVVMIWLLALPVIIALGIAACGFIALVLASNHYFVS